MQQPRKRKTYGDCWPASVVVTVDALSSQKVERLEKVKAVNITIIKLFTHFRASGAIRFIRRRCRNSQHGFGYQCACGERLVFKSTGIDIGSELHEAHAELTAGEKQEGRWP